MSQLATVSTTSAARACRKRGARLTVRRNVCLLVVLIALGTVLLARLGSTVPADGVLGAIEAGLGTPMP